jgi:hypothetical protein
MFSQQNPSRFYKIKIKGDSGKLVFTENVKKSFATWVYLKAIKKVKWSKTTIDEELEKEYVVTEAEKLKPLEKLYESYVEEVRRNLKKKNISLAYYTLDKISFKVKDKTYLEVVSELTVEVVK